VIAVSVFIILAVVLNAFKPPYDEAVEFIKEKKYDQAKDVLKTISADDPLSSKAAVAILVCEMGESYQKGDYEQAYDVLMKTGEKDGRRYYLLNVSPSDSLFAHAATLAHLVAGEVVIKEATDYNADYEDHPEDYGEDSEMMEWHIRYVAEGMNVQHREVDYVDDSGQDDSPPYIASIGIPNLPSAEEWKTELDDLRTRIRQRLIEMKERFERSYAAREEREAKEALAALSFRSKDDAIAWLTDGYWATSIIEHPEHGRIRMYSAFSIQGVATTGLINANSNSSFNVERETCRFGTVEGNVISIIMSGSNSTIRRTGDNSCTIDGMPMERFK
jgi:hypothetical protein